MTRILFAYHKKFVDSLLFETHMVNCIRKYTPNSLVVPNDEIINIIEEFKPDIVYCYDIGPSFNFQNIIKMCILHHIPTIMLGGDLFDKDCIVHATMNKFDVIMGDRKMNSIMQEYQKYYPDKIVTSLPLLCLNKDIFKPTYEEKIYDILIYGSMNFQFPTPYDFPVADQYIERWCNKNNEPIPEKFDFYHLRKRLRDLVLKYPHKYRIKHLSEHENYFTCPHPVRGDDLAKLINQSWLCITDTSIADRCMNKYMEIAGCGTVPLGNLPTDYSDLFNEMVQINNDMNDDEILSIIDKALENKEDLLKRGKILFNKVHSITDQMYGEKLYEISNDIIRQITKNRQYIDCQLMAVDSGSLSSSDTGLGNVLFCIATAYGLAFTTNKYYLCNDIIKLSEKLISFGLPDYRKTIFRHIATNLSCTEFTPYTEKEYNAQEYDEDILPFILETSSSQGTSSDQGTVLKNKNVRLVNGSYQSHLYFDKYILDIRTLFYPTIDSIKYIKEYCPILFTNKNTVAIHIRLNYGDIGYLPSFFYKAMDYITSRIGDCNFLVFSNKIEKCKQILTEGNIFFVDHNKPDYIDLWMMSMCKHNIITYSTLGWWGAYLNPNPNKIVIYAKDLLRIHYAGVYKEPVHIERQNEHYLSDWICLDEPILNQ